MIFFSAVLFGALLGAYRARKRGGSGLDVAQYAAVHAIIFAILGLFLAIALKNLS